MNKKRLIIDTMSSLSEKGACVQRREYKKTLSDLVVFPTPTKNVNYKRAEICSDTICQALRYKERNEQNIMEYMNSRYVEAGFINPQQKMQVLLNDWHRVMRYIKDETRSASFFPSQNIEIDEDLNLVKIHPHVGFVQQDQIELVYYKVGKPNVTQRGDKNKLKRDLQLYATILFARKLGYKKIKASFYFLKKDTDKPIFTQCEPFFFGGGGNIVTLDDVYEDGVPNKLDEDMKEIITLYKAGVQSEQQTKDTCNYCEYAEICKYTKAPISIIEDEERSKEETENEL